MSSFVELVSLSREQGIANFRLSLVPVLTVTLQGARKKCANVVKQDPGRTVKQKQEQISPNHVQTFSGGSVHLRKDRMCHRMSRMSCEIETTKHLLTSHLSAN